MNIDALFPNENEPSVKSSKKNRFINNIEKPSIFQSDQFKQGIIFSSIILFIIILIMTVFKYYQYYSLTKSNSTLSIETHDQTIIVNNLQSKIKLLEEAKAQFELSFVNSQKLLKEAKENYETQCKYKEEHDMKYQENQMGKINTLINEQDLLLRTKEQMNNNLAQVNQILDDQFIKKERILDRYEELQIKLGVEITEGRYGSMLVRNFKQYVFLNKTILKKDSEGKTKRFTMTLRYRGTAKNNDKNEYKKILKNQETAHATLILIKIKNGPIIGGFTFKMFIGNGFVSDHFAVLFNIDNEKAYFVEKERNAIYVDDAFYPVFGEGDLTILSFTECKSEFPKTYGNSKIYPFYELTDKLKEFEIETLEDFAIEFQ